MAASAVVSMVTLQILLADFQQGQDVRDRVRVEPNLTEVGEISNELGILKTTVGNCPEDTCAGPDVGERVTVPKYRYSRQGIKEDPRRVDGCVAVSEDEAIL